MGSKFDPIQTAEGWQISNAPVMGIAPLLASMEIFNTVGMKAIREKSNHLTGFMEYLISENLPSVSIITPKDRGCQLSLTIQSGRSIFENISEEGVICDWREPDVIRVAPHPLFNTFSDVYEFVKILKKHSKTISK
jgi:kynureninase